jgi:hypothetical protein
MIAELNLPPEVSSRLEEIVQIDEWAHERSIDIAEGGRRTSELQAWAQTTKDRLQAIVAELVTIAPDAHSAFRMVISEAVMDLVYLETDACPYLSVRTAALLKMTDRL